MNDWFCKVDGVTCGPFSLDEMVYLRDQGRLQPSDDVRRSADSPWEQAESFADLFEVRPDPPVDGATAVLPEEPREPVDAVATPVAPDEPEDDPDPSDEVSITPPPRRHPNDGKRKRASLGAAVGSAVAVLILLLLLLFLYFGRQSGGSGAVAGTGAGSGAEGGGGGSGGSGLEPALGPGGADQEEIVEEDVTAEAEAVSRTEPAESGSGDATAPPAGNQQFVLSELSVDEPPPSNPPPASGSLGELNRRLAREGAGSGEIQISLIWHNVNDLDLHVICPSGERISFDDPRSACGGELDVDMNAGGRHSRQPVENVYWAQGRAPRGRFVVFVDHFANNGGRDPTAFQVVVKADGRVKKYSGSVRAGQRPKQVCRFTH